MYYEPTPISWQHYHFLIMSAPDKKTLKNCIKVGSQLNFNLCLGFEKPQRSAFGASLRREDLWGRRHYYAWYWCVSNIVPRWSNTRQTSHREMALDRRCLLWWARVRQVDQVEGWEREKLIRIRAKEKLFWKRWKRVVAKKDWCSLCRGSWESSSSCGIGISKQWVCS